jgi:uncharacterized repeat protein (TIGR03803 family)
MRFGRYALWVGSAMAILAGCGGRNAPFNPSPVINSARTNAGHSYSVLHRFGGSGDGEYPHADLLNVKGTLYGTTNHGGANGGSVGAGTVFSITTSGTETVLHSFGRSRDGDFPQAGLIKVNGALYGTTTRGGAICNSYGGCGTVFSLTP